MPFTTTFAAKVAPVMPTYSILAGAQVDGKLLEYVGAGLNRPIADAIAAFLWV